MRFKQKHDLPFTLLADPDHATAEAYGVWVEKSMYGKTFVKPATHADDVLAALRPGGA